MDSVESEPGDVQQTGKDQDAAAPMDEKELLLQRRLARIEEALGLSPLT